LAALIPDGGTVGVVDLAVQLVGYILAFLGGSVGANLFTSPRLRHLRLLQAESTLLRDLPAGAARDELESVLAAGVAEYVATVRDEPSRRVGLRVRRARYAIMGVALLSVVLLGLATSQHPTSWVQPIGIAISGVLGVGAVFAERTVEVRIGAADDRGGTAETD
jgi:hypothetical protein